jgi:signal transduction histidine kinase
VLSLADLARSALPHLDQALARRAELRLAVDPSPLLVFVDRASIECLLLELVLHAATTVLPPYGAIEIRIAGFAEHAPRQGSFASLPCAVAVARGGADFVRLTVTNNGADMDVETTQHVAAWLEGPASTSAPVSYKLRVASRIVGAHGGRMSVEAPAHGSTTVRVELPALGPRGSTRQYPS